MIIALQKYSLEGVKLKSSKLIEITVTNVMTAIILLMEFAI